MVITCSICWEGFQSPVALPCGHVYCEECLRRIIQAVKGIATAHTCPSCRNIYSLDNISDLSASPQQEARSGSAPRRLYMQPHDSARRPRLLPVEQSATELARLQAEKAVLQQQCALWRRRAEAHSAITSRLLQLVQLAESQAIVMKHERDSLDEECKSLKRKRSISLSSRPSEWHNQLVIKCEQVPTRELSPFPITTGFSSESSTSVDRYDRPTKRSRQSC